MRICSRWWARVRSAQVVMQVACDRDDRLDEAVRHQLRITMTAASTCYDMRGDTGALILHRA